MTCSNHTTLDGGALRHAPLRLLDLESICSGRSDQSDWLYQVRPRAIPCKNQPNPYGGSARMVMDFLHTLRIYKGPHKNRVFNVSFLKICMVAMVTTIEDLGLQNSIF